MKKSLISVSLLFLTIGWATVVTSCKEKNEEYPPRLWSEYTYTTSVIAPRTISTVLYENNHSIWLGATGTEGILFNNGYSWQVFNKQSTGIEFDSITAIVRDGNGKIWAGWRSGLACFDGNTWSQIDGFNGLTVTSIAIEGIGNIIVAIKGTSGGIAAFRGQEWIYYTMQNSGIPSSQINSIVSDRNQVLWIATADKGMMVFRNSAWINIADGIPLTSQNFTTVTLAPDGSIWAGSESSQLIHFHDDTFTVLNTGTAKPITSLVISENKNVWCGTAGAGLLKFNGQAWISYTAENAALPSNHILSLVKGDSGNLFFSIPGGKVLMINQ